MRNSSLLLRVTIVVAMALVSKFAYAVADWDMGSYDWPDVERNVTNNSSSSLCPAISKAFGVPVTCVIDHASFDAYYAQQKQKKLGDRDPNTPIDYCAALSMGWFYYQDGQPLMQCKKCTAEFTEKLKSVTCKLGKPGEKSTIAFDSGNLIFTVAPGTMSEGWVGQALANLKEFPAWGKRFRGED